MKPQRDHTAEIRRLEQAYARVDFWAAKRKASLAQKIIDLKRKSGMV